MKKILYSILCIGIVSCGGNNLSESEPDNVNPNDSAMSVEAEVEDVIEVVESEVFEFNYFEDYGVLKTKDELVNTFGKENIVDGESWYAEGTVKFEHSTLTNPDNGHVITFLYKEDDPTTVNFIEADVYLMDEDYNIKGTQKIESKCGAFLGMSLKELRDWNQADFNFSGFGWDYAGGIFADEESKIGECPVQFTLSFDMEITIEGHNDLYGDVELNTADENVQGAPILLNTMTFYLGE